MRPLARSPSVPRARLSAWLVTALTLLAPAAGLASDGVIELNQVCATQTGCLPGDAPGFPITLNQRGSYRLTGTLTVPNQNTNGIEISDFDISLDFNGFTLLGPGTVPISTHICTLPGSGSGVVVTGNGAGLVVQNGHVRGMGQDGINADTQNVRIERMIAERNCRIGIWVGIAGLVIDSQARANGDSGINTGVGSRVRDSIADNNGSIGIAVSGYGVVTGCASTANRASGFFIGGPGGVAMGNIAVGNIGYGIQLTGGTATNNSVSANTIDGIFADSLAGVGLNAASGNAGSEIFGGVAIACNVLDGVKACP